MGIGSGIFIGSILEAYTLINDGVAYTGSIFLIIFHKKKSAFQVKTFHLS